MNYIHCKDCDKSLGKHVTLYGVHCLLSDHLKETGHKNIQIFRYQKAYLNFLTEIMLQRECFNCGKIHCHRCKKENTCLLGGLCVDCYGQK